MKTFIILLTAFCGIASISCKKAPITEPKRESNHCTNDLTQSSRVKYMPLKVGAYWVYQKGNMDTLESITYFSGIDSVYVSGDTIINGVQHFILKHSDKYYSCYYGFDPSVNEVYYNATAQYIIPFRITEDQIGDTTRMQPGPVPGYTLYEIPNYYLNMPTALGLKNGLWFEHRCSYPVGTPEYFSRFFGYESYVENIGLNRFVMSFSHGPETRIVYELIRYGGIN